jgi:hypothetical protein
MTGIYYPDYSIYIMEGCNIDEAYKSEKPIFETFHINEKKKLLENFDESTVHDVSDNRRLKKYESPVIRVTENSYIEGKFRDNPKHRDNSENDSTSVYPYPFMHKDRFFDNKFFFKLKSIMNSKKKYAVPYSHLEQCRLCFKPLGNKEYVLQSGNQTFRLYDGMMHYYLRHNVWPSKELYWFVTEM